MTDTPRRDRCDLCGATMRVLRCEDCGTKSPELNCGHTGAHDVAASQHGSHGPTCYPCEVLRDAAAETARREDQ